MYCGLEGTNLIMGNNSNLGETFLLTRCENSISPSNDFVFYIGYDNHPLTNTFTTCLRANLTYEV